MFTSTTLSRPLIVRTLLVSSMYGLSLVSAYAAVPLGVPEGGVPGGKFSAYFRNITSVDCLLPGVVTGFDKSTDLYGSPVCSSIAPIIGPIAATAVATSLSSAAPIAGKVLAGYTAGTWIYKNSFEESGANLFYTAGNVGIGTSSFINSDTRFQIGAAGPSNRPVRFDTNAGITSRGDTGGWAMGHFFEGSAGTSKGGFGALGTADVLDYLYAGDTYSSPTMVWKGGSVGIGTVAPGARLDIASTTDNGLRLTKTSGDNWNYMEFVKGGLRTSWIGRDNSSGNFTLQSEVGNNGISLNPYSGTVGIRAYAITGATLKVGGNINTDNIPVPDHPDWYDLQAGSIGIGTAYAYSALCVGNSVGTCAGVGGVVIGLTNTNADTNFENNGSGFLMGNLGIGIKTPSAKLHVNGNAIVSGNVTASAFYYSSDKNLKKNILPLDNSLEKILSLSGYSFDWKSDNRKDIGVIAQEVERVFPELVQTDAITGLKSVEYANLVAPLIEAMKSQQEQIELLKAQIEKIESAQ